MTAPDSATVSLWPVLMGWILVVCMYLFSWKRQALIATLGMLIVTLMVVTVRFNPL